MLHGMLALSHLTTAARKLLQAGARDWEDTVAIIARFSNVKVEDLA